MKKKKENDRYRIVEEYKKERGGYYIEWAVRIHHFIIASPSSRIFFFLSKTAIGPAGHTV
jgi:hypothetical protein